MRPREPPPIWVLPAEGLGVGRGVSQGGGRMSQGEKAWAGGEVRHTGPAPLPSL